MDSFRHNTHVRDYVEELLFARKKFLLARGEAMPLVKAHKRRRCTFLAELMRKRHCLLSSAREEPRTVNTVPVSLDAEVGPVSMETSLTEG